MTAKLDIFFSTCFYLLKVLNTLSLVRWRHSKWPTRSREISRHLVHSSQAWCPEHMHSLGYGSLLVINDNNLLIYKAPNHNVLWRCTNKSTLLGLLCLYPLLYSDPRTNCQCNVSHRLISDALLTHWGRVTHICVGKLTIIGSDNSLSPGRRQAIIWTSAGVLLIGPLGTNFSEILIGIHTFSFKKIHLKMSSAKCRPFVSASMC